MRHGGGPEKDRMNLELAASEAVYSVKESVHLSVGIANHTGMPQLVVSHVLAGDMVHFDNIELEVHRLADGHSWRFALTGLRNAAARVACLLQPGDTLRQDIDLSAWLKLLHLDIGNGTFQMRARYKVGEAEAPFAEWGDCRVAKGTLRSRSEESRRPWHGELVSNPITIRIGAP